MAENGTYQVISLCRGHFIQSHTESILHICVNKMAPAQGHCKQIETKHQCLMCIYYLLAYKLCMI